MPSISNHLPELASGMESHSQISGGIESTHAFPMFESSSPALLDLEKVAGRTRKKLHRGRKAVSASLREHLSYRVGRSVLSTRLSDLSCDRSDLRNVRGFGAGSSVGNLYWWTPLGFPLEI